MSRSRSKSSFSLSFWRTVAVLLAFGCAILSWQREPVQIIDLNNDMKIQHLMMREHIRDIEALNQILLKQNLELSDEVHELIVQQPQKHQPF